MRRVTFGVALITVAVLIALASVVVVVHGVATGDPRFVRETSVTP